MFIREVDLFDDASTRKKFTMMNKWEVITDDGRNPVWEGLEEFLQFGKRYRVTIEEVGDVDSSAYDSQGRLKEDV